MTNHKTSISTVTYNNYPDKNAEAARITKCDETYRDGVTVYVIRYKNICAVVSTAKYVNSCPLVLLYSQRSSDLDALGKFYQLVGKMCRKGIDSKYFYHQMESEHFFNGCRGNEDKELQVQFRNLLLTKFYLE